MAGLTGDRKLAIRPFQPGEQVKNADGSYSTERTVTVPTREGGWTVVPSLWMGPNGPVDLLPMGDDFIADVASKCTSVSRGKRSPSSANSKRRTNGPASEARPAAPIRAR